MHIQLYYWGYSMVSQLYTHHHIEAILFRLKILHEEKDSDQHNLRPYGHVKMRAII